jgi:hypothetical protein
MKASELLAQSAIPFDEACMKVLALEKEIEALRKSITQAKRDKIGAEYLEDVANQYEEYPGVETYYDNIAENLRCRARLLKEGKA